MQCLTIKKTDRFSKPRFCTAVINGTESIKFLGSKICEILPHEIKKRENIKEFKKAIKQGKPTPGLCGICKTDIHRLGFIRYRVSHICF